MKLEIGSGGCPHAGYTNLDIDPKWNPDIVADARKIPLDDNSVDEILAQHVIEHFYWTETSILLKEWYRVLKPNGIIKIICPDLDYILRVYFDLDNAFLDTWEKEVDEKGMSFPHGADKDKDLWINFKLFSSACKYDNHFAAFNFRLLKKKLLEAGFTTVERLKARRSLNVVARKPKKGAKAICSLCMQSHESVHRRIFDGMCTDCVEKAKYQEQLINVAKKNNKRMI